MSLISKAKMARLASFFRARGNGDAHEAGSALKRLVWRLAQRAVDNEAIWAAISEIGEELAWMITNIEAEREDDPKVGDRAETKMGGHQARAIMRRAGVTPGMLGVRLG
jgi:hypothetical protein